MPVSRRAAWYQSIRAHTILLELMDAELRSECGVPLAWYDVLIEISKAPGQAMRMSALADQVLLSRSWLTRRVAQLERAGLVERRAAAKDGRGVVAAMTLSGRKKFAAMEESHARSIQRHFSAHLNDDEAQTLATTFARIADAGARQLAEDDPSIQ